MSSPAVSFDQLLARARQGDQAALTELLDQCRVRMLSVATGAHEQMLDTAPVAALLDQARREFSHFSGTTEPEFLAWVQSLGNGPGETLSGAASFPPGSTQSAPGDNPLGATVAVPAEKGEPAGGASAPTLAGPPVPMSMPPSLAPTKAPARRFGNYDLIEAIARGGMGVVYKARHLKLNRIVALKMILSGQFADDLEVQRFYSEAEAAAKLRHPNIVGIHDVGECERQHFFSMDYIEGKSLADLLKDQALPPRQAAEIVQTLASAMHYAHQEGVVHRDLKPSNVLLDAAGSPLITDFGLAKQVSGGSRSHMTMTGTVVGTPSYMPPEQAQGRIEEIGVRSDVYSLGAILYELLSGRPPFRGAGVMETLRQVIENEPVALRALSPAIPRDLETIYHKCLQKEPDKRYQTAKELADELGRFLRGEPILARPISPIARGWRWCKRNPVIAATSAAALFGLVLALIASTVGYVQTSAALQKEQAALAESEESRRQAMQAVDDLFTQVSENTLLNKPGLQPLRKELLGRALTYYQRFLKQREGDPRVQDELASSHFRIGLITEAIESIDQALPMYETARRLQEQLVRATPNHPARLEAYGNTLNALGTALAAKKEHDEAQKHLTAAAEVRTKLTQLAPRNSEYQRLLANTYMNLGVSLRGSGDPAGAREKFVQAQAIRTAALQVDSENWKLHRDLGKGHYGLANLARQEGNEQEAREQLERAAEEFEYVVGRDPDDLDNRRLLAICYRLLGDMHSTSDVAAARQWYEKAHERLKPLADQNPDVVDYQADLASLELNRGYLDSDDGQSGAAEAAFRAAVEILTPLGSSSDTLPRYRRDLAVALRALGSEQLVAGRREEGLANLRRAHKQFAELNNDFPDDPDYAQQLAEIDEVLQGDAGN